jgi:hypothetical protein
MVFMICLLADHEMADRRPPTQIYGVYDTFEEKNHNEPELRDHRVPGVIAKTKMVSA